MDTFDALELNSSDQTNSEDLILLLTQKIEVSDIQGRSETALALKPSEGESS